MAASSSAVKPPDVQRRRLTVAACDPVVGSVRGTSPDPEDAEKRLQKSGLWEVFSKVPTGKHAVSITSVTDRDLKRRRSFAEKDYEVLVPPGRDLEAEQKFLVDTGVGFCCKKGLKPESPNQDSFCVLYVEGEFALYGVFDGHGPCGHDISDMARELLVAHVLKHPKFPADPEIVLTEAFTETQAQLEKTGLVDPSTSGTTCSMLLHDIRADRITVAHVGDSRAIVGRRGTAEAEYEGPIDLTIDHKPNLEKERTRIETANPPGRVVFDGFYNHRVFAQNGNYPGLNMSRALGDVIAHREAGLTAVPDCITIDLRAERDKFAEVTVLLCTDGVWEFIDSKEALSILNTARLAAPPGSKSEVAANKLAEESWNRWMKDSHHEISDDITVMMVPLASFYGI